MRIFFLLSFLSIAVCQAQNQSATPLPVTPRQFAAALRITASDAGQEELHHQVLRLFGLKNLTQGRAGAKTEGTTVVWAAIDSLPARVVRQDGSLIGEMIPLGDDGLQVLAADMPNFT